MNTKAFQNRIFQLVGKLWGKTTWQMLLLAFAIPFFVRNLLLPLVGDDYSYAFIWDGEHWGNLMDNIGPRERVQSFHDIIISQWSHYLTWGGRTFSMIWIQFFAWVGEFWFDIANTGVFILLMVSLYWLSMGKMVSPARQKGVFFWVMLCMLFGVIDYPSTMLWMTGACVYLWTGLWECIFLLPFVTKRHPPVWLMVLLGLQAGWSEEAGSLITVLITAYYLFIAFRRKQVERWMVWGFIFLLIGCGFIMLAPGSLNREHLMLELEPEYVLPAEKLFSTEMFMDNFLEGFLPILIWEGFLFIPIVLWWLKCPHSDHIIPVFTAAGMLVLCAMMFAPEFALRTGFHSTMFLTVASAAAFRHILPWMKKALIATPMRKSITLACGSLCCLYALLVMLGCFYVESSYRQQFEDRLEEVKQHKNDDLIVVRAFYIPHDLDSYLGPRSITDFHLIYAADLETNPNDNRSLMFSRYYHLPPIRIDREVDWKKYE